jgi:hypothetical protein
VTERTPPDGHWHRRTPDPVKTVERVRVYGCQVKGCGWQVHVAPDRSEEIRRAGG